MDVLSPIRQSVSLRFSRLVNHQILFVGLSAMGVHLLLLFFDFENKFIPFARGDRSAYRLQALQEFLAAAQSDVLRTMVTGSVQPGEYLLLALPYLIAGTAGIILFQIFLTVISIVCLSQIAKVLIPRRWSVLAFGLFYLLLPQNLVFPHQFVTEAIATPFSVFFLYFVYRYLGGGARSDMLWGGLCLGMAIFSRPSMAFVLPPFLVLAVFYRKSFGVRRFSDLAIFSAAALAPLSIWVLIFTAGTGHVGYTDGVATLNWNLRSKIFLVETANDIAKSSEVESFKDYSDMYSDSGGVKVSRFLEIAAENPAVFAKAAVVDLVIMVGRGNSTKLTVDYFGMARDQSLKTWRDTFGSEGAKGLFSWGLGAGDRAAVFIIEGLWSLFTSLWSLSALALIAVTFCFRSRIEKSMKPQDFGFIALSATLIFAAIVSAELVDRAQARLRNPAEGAILLLAGLALSYISPRPKKQD